MFDIDQLPDSAARLWEATAVATGGHHDVMVTVGPDGINVTRMAVLEVLFSDDPPTRDDVESWVIATAHRLGFPNTELTHNGTPRSPHRMKIVIPLDGFTVSIQGYWDEFPDSDDEPGHHPGRASSKRSHLELVSAHQGDAGASDGADER
jgi:hypothetical protein